MHPAPANRVIAGRAAKRVVDGVLLLDKAVGLSSNAALQQVKRLFNAAKAGHTGTLDPLASGLLPICLGEATKFAQLLLDADKGYCATLRLGTTTTTGDAEGEPLQQREVRATLPDVEAVLPRFLGAISQRPPRHAALKYQGRNYYEYAREGVDIPRPARDVVIHELRIVEWAPPLVRIEVLCSKGTYVRVLAEELGEALQCGAHLAALRRTRTGGFRLEDAATLEALAAMTEEERGHALLAADAPCATLPRCELSDAQAHALAQGRALSGLGIADGLYRVYAGVHFRGLAHAEGGVLSPRRLVAARSL